MHLHNDDRAFFFVGLSGKQRANMKCKMHDALDARTILDTENIMCLIARKGQLSLFFSQPNDVQENDNVDRESMLISYLSVQDIAVFEHGE